MKRSRSPETTNGISHVLAASHNPRYFIKALVIISTVNNSKFVIVNKEHSFKDNCKVISCGLFLHALWNNKIFMLIKLIFILTQVLFVCLLVLLFVLFCFVVCWLFCFCFCFCFCFVFLFLFCFFFVFFCLFCFFCFFCLFEQNILDCCFSFTLQLTGIYGRIMFHT